MNTNAQQRGQPARKRSASILLATGARASCSRKERGLPAREAPRDLEGRAPFVTAPLRVLYFAQAAEAAACRSETWEITTPLNAEQFWHEAIRRHPSLDKLRGQCRLAVNHEFLNNPGELIPPHSEVAVLPPVSGG